MSSLSRLVEWDTGDTLTASDLNDEFDNILNDYNGGITNANISSSAAIAWSKISKTGASLSDFTVYALETLSNVTISGVTDNQVLTYDSSDNKWKNEDSTATGIPQIERAVYGNLATGTDQTLRWYNKTGDTLTIDKVFIYVDTAPTGASLIIDVNKDGSTIFSTQSGRPTIAAGEHSGTSGTPDTTSVANGSYLTFDIDQVGSTVAGADLLIVVYFT